MKISLFIILLATLNGYSLLAGTFIDSCQNDVETYKPTIELLKENLGGQSCSEIYNYLKNSKELYLIGDRGAYIPYNMGLLEEFSNITSVMFFRMDIENLEFLRGWDNLESFTLFTNQQSLNFQPLDLSTFAGKNLLKNISIVGRVIDNQCYPMMSSVSSITISIMNDNVEFLKSFPNLQKLTIDSMSKDTPIMPKLGALKGLIHVSSLQLGIVVGVKAKNLSEIEGFKDELIELHLRSCTIEDLSDLDKFENLQSLDLAGTRTSPNFILKNKKLIRLDLCDMGIKDIKSIGDLENIESLMLSGNDIEDLSPLRNLKKLNHFENPNPESIKVCPTDEDMPELIRVFCLQLQPQN